MEHWELLCPGGYGFFWDSNLFRPSTDTFLLSSLPKLRPGLRVCDLGSGTGLLSILLLQRQPDMTVAGVELQEEAVRLAERCAIKNGLEDRLSFRQGDLRRIREIFPAARFGGLQSPLLSTGQRQNGGRGSCPQRPGGDGLFPGGDLCRRRVSPALGRAVLPDPQAGAVDRSPLRPPGGIFGAEAAAGGL